MKSRISVIVAGLLVAGMAMAQQAEIDRYLKIRILLIG